MRTANYVSKILWYEAIGFLTIIIFSWINELSALPYLIGHRHYISNWQEGVLETLIVVTAAIPVMFFTKRLVSRLHHLEKFLRICSWCRNIEFDGKWIPLEEFISQKFKTETTHGMCPNCAEKMKADLKNRQG